MTILDLEPDNLTKSYGRSHKASESDDQTPPTNTVSQKHFVPNHDSWTHAVLEDYFANCLVEVQTPAHTPSSPQSPVESPTEEINAGFEGSVEDLSPPATPAHAAVPRKPDDGGSVSRTDVQTPKSKPKIHKTPSPKKLPHPGITKKDNKEDTSQQLLIIDKRDEERHAFTNPAMEVEWSNFVGQSSTDPEDEISVDAEPQDLNKSSSSSKGQRQSPLPVKEPAAMVMDRGGIGSGGEESVEGTPDHTTQLLKSSAVVVEEEEKEEVVYVVEDGAGSVSVSSKVVVSVASLYSSLLCTLLQWYLRCKVSLMRGQLPLKFIFCDPFKQGSYRSWENLESHGI